MNQVKTATSDYQKGVSATEHVVELERRDAVVSSEVKNASGSTRNTEVQYDFGTFEDTNEQYVVVNLAHRRQRPEKEMPALRVLGVFSSLREAQDYIKTAAPLLLGCNLWCLEMRKWSLISKTMERQQDPKYSTRKIELLKKMNADDKKKRDADFAKNKEKKQMGALKTLEKPPKTVSSRSRALEEIQKKTLKKETSSGADDVPSCLVRRKQDYLVISFIRDTTPAVKKKRDDPEPAFIVWRFFATYDMAKEWGKTLGRRYILDYDTEIVDTYEWLFPENVDRSQVQESWSHPEQNKILSQTKAEPERVKDFEQWCKNKGIETPVTEVFPPNENQSTVPTATSLLEDTMDKPIPSGAVKLLPKTFQVTTLETKEKTDPLRIESTLDDYSFLRRPVVEALTVPDEEPKNSDSIHAPLDE
jgi:hypothetical protein